MALKNLTYFKERENFDGKKDLILILDCYKCSQEEKNFFKTKKCIQCFINTLFKNRNRKFNYVSILWNELLIEENQLNYFLDYFKVLKKIKRIYQKIEKNRNFNCKYREFKCKLFSNSSSYNLKEYEWYDPIFIYNYFVNQLSILIKKEIIDSFCQNCYNYKKKSETDILEILNNLKIIQKFKNFLSESKNHENHDHFYEYFLIRTSYLINNLQKFQNKGINKDKKLLNSYKTGKYNTFKVYIYENSEEIEKNYKVTSFYKGEKQEDYFDKIIQDINQNIELAEFDQLIPSDKLIKLYKREALKVLNLKYDISKSIKKKIGFLTALKKINLDKLFPLLIDDFIEEIFLDSPKDEIYLNHQIYGRCRTELSFNSKEIERIKTLVRLYSGQRLDFMNPIIKFVIKNEFFYCRFSIDVEPIQINNFALDIRKLNKNILTIQDLLKNGTLDPLIASFLYFNIIRRKNITVTGETNTGKTTLINALDLLTPKEFRKIYIENITESLNEIEYGKHQLKYKVDSLEESLIKKYSKSNQIKTLLHRTPDIIYLGEILTKEEALAMFHCLAAGLRGFQTIHSKDIDSLMNRFLYHFGIDTSCLNDLDLIILMKKDINKRKIIGIFEVCNSVDTKSKFYDSIFEYNPETNKWILTKSLYETNVTLDIKKYEVLPKENFYLFIKIYSDIFEFLRKIKKIENTSLVDLFHQISYFSLKSFESLELFWSNWKKNRSLNL
ncbi:MAG: ATPase, T2SS/T4P/T4SS family [Candidatus Lokiarchaeia archaeon]